MSHCICSNFVLSFDKCKLHIFPQIKNGVEYTPSCDPNNITYGYTDKPYVISVELDNNYISLYDFIQGKFKCITKRYENDIITRNTSKLIEDLNNSKLIDNLKQDLTLETDIDDFKFMENKNKESSLNFSVIDVNNHSDICYVYIPSKYNKKPIIDRYIRIYAEYQHNNDYKGTYTKGVDGDRGLNIYDYWVYDINGNDYNDRPKLKFMKWKYDIFTKIIPYFVLPYCIEQMKRLNINTIKIAGNFLNYPRTKAMNNFCDELLKDNYTYSQIRKKRDELIYQFNSLFCDKYQEAADRIIGNICNIPKYFINVIPSREDNDITLIFTETEEEADKLLKELQEKIQEEFENNRKKQEELEKRFKEMEKLV
jgi:hypothetical protein